MTQITIPAQVVNGHLQHEKSLAELEGQHFLVTLTGMPPEEAGQRWRDKIAAMKKLEEGWDSYRAPAPSVESIAQATDFLAEVARSANALSRLAPSVVGGVGFTFTRASRKAYVEFRNTGSVHALFSDGVTDPMVEKVEITPVGYADLLAKIKRYFDE